MSKAEELKQEFATSIKNFNGLKWEEYTEYRLNEDELNEFIKQILIDFTEHAKYADGFDRDIIDSFLSKQEQ